MTELEAPAGRGAVATARFMVDRDYNVVWANAVATPWMGSALHRNLWDAWPHAEPIFRPIHEHAWATGEASALAFYNGALYDISARAAADDKLIVSYVLQDSLDITSLRAVIESLRRMRQAVAQAPVPEPHPRPPLLRIVEAAPASP